MHSRHRQGLFNGVARSFAAHSQHCHGATIGEALDYDEWRTKKLREYGFTVLWFLNDEVKHDLDAMIQVIRAQVHARDR